MQTGLNAAFGQELAPGDLAGIESLGFAVIRNSVTAPVLGTVQQFKGSSVRPLFLIGTPTAGGEAFNWLVETAIQLLGPNGFDCEIGNEPDIKANNWGGPGWYAGQVTSYRNTLRNAGHTGQIWGGAVSNLQAAGLAYLEEVVPGFPADVGVSFHGYSVAAAEIVALKAFVGSRPIACTEFGWSSGPSETDAQIAALATQALTLFADNGCQLACYYQLNDGPEPGDQFGIRTIVGLLKPVAKIFGGTAPVVVGTMRRVHCQILDPAGVPILRTTPIAGQAAVDPVNAGDVDRVVAGVMVADGEMTFAYEPDTPPWGVTYTVIARGMRGSVRDVVPPLLPAPSDTQGPTIQLAATSAPSPFDLSRPAPVVQPSLGSFDPDDPGGMVSRSLPPGRVIPVGPTKRWFRGNLMVELVDANGVPLPVPMVPGGNTTPPNSVMSWFLPKYTRDWQDLILTGHCERSLSHFHLDHYTADAIGLSPVDFVDLVAYVLTWLPFCSFWGIRPAPGGWQSWADAEPDLQPLLDALKAAGPGISEKCILLFTKEEDSAASGNALLDISQHVMPQAKDMGLSCYHHFDGRVPAWMRPGQTQAEFWQEQIALGVQGLCYQALCVKPGFQPTDPAGIVPAGTMMAQLWDATKVIGPAGGDNVFFEGCATNKLYGTRNERDGNRLGLEAVYATGQWGPSGYGDGGCLLTGEPL